MNPQVLSVRLTQLGADQDLNLQQPIPIPRLPTRQGRSLVWEVLWVEYWHLNPGVAATGTISQVNVALTTRELAAGVSPAGAVAASTNFSNFRNVGTTTLIPG